MIKQISQAISTFFTEHESVMKNFFSMSFMKGLEYIAPLILIPYLVRTLGIATFGTMQSVVSYMYIFYMLTNYGFSYSAARQISVHRDNREKIQQIASSVMVLKILFMIASFVLMIIGVIIFPHLNAEFGLCLLTFGFVAGDVLLPVWLYQGYEKLHILSRFQIFSRVLIFAFTLLLIKTPEDYLLYPIIYYGIQCIAGIASLLLIPKLFGVHFIMPKKEHLIEELKLGIGPFKSILSQALYANPRLFYLSLFAHPIVTGQFAVAEKAAGVFQLFPVWLFVFSALPRLSLVFEQNKDECFEKIKHYQKITIIYALILLPFAMYFAPEIIFVFSGDYIEEAVFLFRIMYLETVIIHSNIFILHFFAASGRYDLFSRIYIITCIGSLLMYAVIVPIYGALGMALCIVASALLLVFCTQYTIGQHKNIILSS
jgi:PST family polysaccharide transporter